MRVPSLDSLPGGLRDQAAQRLGAKVPGRSKYHAVMTYVDGMRFASKLEARCYAWLMERQGRGEVKWFITQVPFRLPGGIIYRVDFLAVRSCGAVELIDAKGMLTPVSAVKIKQVEALYGVKVILWHD